MMLSRGKQSATSQGCFDLMFAGVVKSVHRYPDQRFTDAAADRWNT